jgi:hypothetical protein
MGWQDDPVVGGAPAWASDPVVSHETAGDFQRADAKATTIPQSITIGAGRMSDRLMEGLKQSGYGVGAILSELLPDHLKQVAQDALAQKLLTQQQQQTENTARYKPLQDAHPVATTVGEAIPLAASPMLRVADGAGALGECHECGHVGGAAVHDGVRDGRRARGAWSGCCGGRCGRFRRDKCGCEGAKTRAEPVDARAAAARPGVAQDSGINLSAGQKTGNKFLQTLESTFESLPTTSGTATAEKQAQRTALTQAVMSRLGVNANEATDQTLGQARGKIGGDFDRIFSKVDVPLAPPEVMKSLGAVVQDANRNLVPEQARLVANRADDLLSKVDADGNVPGKAYQAWRSVVQKQAAGANGSLKDSLRDLYRAVDGSAYDAAGKVGEADNLVQARARYRDLLTAEAAMKNVTDGLMPAGTLALGREQDWHRWHGRPRALCQGVRKGPDPELRERNPARSRRRWRRVDWAVAWALGLTWRPATRMLPRSMASELPARRSRGNSSCRRSFRPP